MNRRQLTDAQAWEAILTAGEFLLFKHSKRCPTSSHAFGEYRLFVEQHPEVAHGWIDVLDQRAWAREVADRTGVRHKSPQALWLRDGQVLWHASHFDITQGSLGENVRPG